VAVSEVRHTAVTNSKNSVFKIAFIDKDVFNAMHRKDARGQVSDMNEG